MKENRIMSDKNTYLPPKIWTWDAENGGEWAKINRPRRRRDT